MSDREVALWFQSGRLDRACQFLRQLSRASARVSAPVDGLADAAEVVRREAEAFLRMARGEEATGG